MESVSGSISIRRFIEICLFNANSVDPYQTPRVAASDLALHHLSMSLLWDARLKRVKETLNIFLFFNAVICAAAPSKLFVCKDVVSCTNICRVPRKLFEHEAVGYLKCHKMGQNGTCLSKQ